MNDDVLVVQKILARYVDAKLKFGYQRYNQMSTS